MIVYECPACEQTVTGGPLRVSCPDCGAALESVGTRSDPAYSH